MSREGIRSRRAGSFAVANFFLTRSVRAQAREGSAAALHHPVHIAVANGYAEWLATSVCHSNIVMILKCVSAVVMSVLQYMYVGMTIVKSNTYACPYLRCCI